MERIVIDSASTEQTSKGDDYILVKSTGGDFYSCYNAPYFELLLNSKEVEAEIKSVPRGNKVYRNIMSAKTVVAGSPTPTTRGSGFPTEKDTSIVRQNTINRGTDVVIAILTAGLAPDNLTPTNVEKWFVAKVKSIAHQFENDIFRVEEEEEIPVPVTPPVPEVDEESDIPF
jgi:hypothetical protein